MQSAISSLSQREDDRMCHSVGWLSCTAIMPETRQAHICWPTPIKGRKGGVWCVCAALIRNTSLKTVSDKRWKTRVWKSSVEGSGALPDIGYCGDVFCLLPRPAAPQTGI